MLTELMTSSTAISVRMSRWRPGDTAPERDLGPLVLRSVGPFRMHYPVSGPLRRSADIVFTQRSLAVFIDGCFWQVCGEHGSVAAFDSGGSARS
jgi:DNA mismatch endonuclease, patch repair protein